MDSAFSRRDAELMRRALELASCGPRGANPIVGAVVASLDGTVLGEGYHHGAGTPHAEPTAIADARAQGHDVTGAQIFITLEPCNHTGRTGPCSQALLDAGIARVTFAAPDGTDKAAGGADVLRAHGVDVRSGLLRADAEALNERWMRAMAERRPFVTAKIATSLDFALAAADGTSQWITSPESRAHAQSLRSRADAVLVGTGTLAVDNPRLTARDDDGGLRDVQPIRAVMGLSPVPEDAAVRGVDGRFRRLATRSPREALASLAAEGVGHVMIEGGPRLIGAFLDADLVDELWHYQAPILLPGGRQASDRKPVPTLEAAQRFRLDEVRRVGPDVFLRSSPLPGLTPPQASDRPSTAHDPESTR